MKVSDNVTLGRHLINLWCTWFKANGVYHGFCRVYDNVHTSRKNAQKFQSHMFFLFCLPGDLSLPLSQYLNRYQTFSHMIHSKGGGGVY